KAGRHNLADARCIGYRILVTELTDIDGATFHDVLMFFNSVPLNGDLINTGRSRSRAPAGPRSSRRPARDATPPADHQAARPALRDHPGLLPPHQKPGSDRDQP